MHAYHFSYGVGAFLAPVISRPFLDHMEEGQNRTNETAAEHTSPLSTSPLSGNVSTMSGGEAVLQTSIWTIKTLYPMIGSYALLFSWAFLVYYFKDRNAEGNRMKEDKEEEPLRLSRAHIILTVSLLSILNLLYGGIEVAFGNFVSVFAVQSKLQFTRQHVIRSVITNDDYLLRDQM